MYKGTSFSIEAFREEYLMGCCFFMSKSPVETNVSKSPIIFHGRSKIQAPMRVLQEPEEKPFSNGSNVLIVDEEVSLFNKKHVVN
jgi:hypothetical protein